MLTVKIELNGIEIDRIEVVNFEKVSDNVYEYVVRHKDTMVTVFHDKTETWDILLAKALAKLRDKKLDKKA